MIKVYKNEKGFHIIELLLVLMVIGVIGSIGWYVYKKNPPQTSKTVGSATLLSAQPQFSSRDSVAGYLKYNPAKFTEVKSIGLPTIKSTGNAVNVVIVAANTVSYGESGLYLYDLTTNKNYKLTSGGGDPRIMSDHFLIYGIDEGSGSSKKLGARLLDLNTGENKLIFSGAPENVPGTVCCSVSPDGFKLALAQKNKLSIWDIRTGKTKDYTETLNPISEGFTRNSSNDYAVEMSYATPAWADSDRIIYADKPATKTVMEGVSATKPTIDTNLFLLNITDGKSSELPTGNSGIYEIYASGGTNFIYEVLIPAQVYQFSKLSSSGGSMPEPIGQTFGNFHLLSQKGDRLYLFPEINKSGVFTSLDTATKIAKTFNALPPEISKVTQVIPKGWAGEDRIILSITDTSGAIIHEYIAIYNTTSEKTEQYTTVK